LRDDIIIYQIDKNYKLFEIQKFKNAKKIINLGNNLIGIIFDITIEIPNTDDPYSWFSLFSTITKGILYEIGKNKKLNKIQKFDNNVEKIINLANRFIAIKNSNGKLTIYQFNNNKLYKIQKFDNVEKIINLANRFIAIKNSNGKLTIHQFIGNKLYEIQKFNKVNKITNLGNNLIEIGNNEKCHTIYLIDENDILYKIHQFNNVNKITNLGNNFITIEFDTTNFSINCKAKIMRI